jgi:hypothetical protein
VQAAEYVLDAILGRIATFVAAVPVAQIKDHNAAVEAQAIFALCAGHFTCGARLPLLVKVLSKYAYYKTIYTAISTGHKD